eukprot:CAMPEP_0116848616 /NCGR_PEP_ID=MMETSP0418-20121206/15106_1 /TAXON_ID=1158023 /ORGANISM="Astrosyne radiata, Strain 13vi08-1A" /LENGTH=119 /DNA_ID=CAMNT_0004480227 /DNA_START=140 /DNA_END=499 /DNA_ORIENTATION=+
MNLNTTTHANNNNNNREEKNRLEEGRTPSSLSLRANNVLQRVMKKMQSQRVQKRRQRQEQWGSFDLSKIQRDSDIFHRMEELLDVEPTPSPKEKQQEQQESDDSVLCARYQGLACGRMY